MIKWSILTAIVSGRVRIKACSYQFQNNKPFDHSALKLLSLLLEFEISINVSMEELVNKKNKVWNISDFNSGRFRTENSFGTSLTINGSERFKLHESHNYVYMFCY